MFYKLSAEAYDEIKKMLESDDPNLYKSLYKRDEKGKLNYSNSDLIKTLNKYNLSDGKFIGKGLFSIVYEKDSYVYKFTLNRSDILKTMLFASLYNKVPEKYKKHIIDVIDFDFDESTKFYCIVVEKLYPLNQTEIGLLLGNESKTEQNFVASTLITEKVINNILNEFSKIDNIKLEIEKIIQFSSTKNILMDKIVQDLNKTYFLILNNKNDQDNKNAIVINARRFASSIVLTINSFIKNLFGKELENKSKIIELMKYVSKYYLDLVRLPTSYQKDIKKFDTSRYGGDLLEFLRYMKENYNIFFKDLHTGNLMKRANGDIVLSDVGLFEIK